jgi:hypothetical protein
MDLAAWILQMLTATDAADAADLVKSFCNGAQGPGSARPGGACPRCAAGRTATMTF